MGKYAKYSGQEMNVGKSKVVLQGHWNLRITPMRLEGFEVVKSVRYLGIQLGTTTIEEQYAAPMKKFTQKMIYLQSLPLSEVERVQAIMTWACPVFSVVGKVVYPTQEIQKVSKW
uniref:Reverse transcriptase domain-containing protein n=1 Tax=Eutreptiella gymnastica TaxID=73025 RepID=A0A7S1ICI2_9EUGL|mmetsp:Transcript_145621/g.254197  ORF Transcript_145621/g.254197 Transcript_145621/m.254197 type:complete len:115 (+) Transcript_145621:43-387(+)